MNAVFEYLRLVGFRFLAVNATALPPPAANSSHPAPAVACSGTTNPSFSFRSLNPAFFPYTAYTGGNHGYWPGSDAANSAAPLADRSLYAVGNHFNGAMDGGELPGLPTQWGGAAGGALGYNIAGFVHTSENIVPSSTYPEWYGGSK